MKSFIQFLKESTQSLQNRFPDVLRMMAKTGSSPARVSVYPAPKPGRKRKATKVTVYPPGNTGDNYGQYLHNFHDNTGEIEISDKDDNQGTLGHEFAHATQSAGLASDSKRQIFYNPDRDDIPYSLDPDEIDARSVQAALLGRKHARDYLSDTYRNAKQGKPVPSIEDIKNQSKANHDDALIDIGRIEDAEEEKPSKSFSKPKLLKKLRRRVLGGYEHGFRYAANPTTLKSIRRKAEKNRKQNS